ncbi:MAG: hypothetical protein H7305_03745 [Gemmatimonadaceae bacterium]|nr:hypothetical protein [Gemmatimonadaceae bacterium]
MIDEHTATAVPTVAPAATGPATIRHAFDTALDPRTGKARAAGSEQNSDWKRASREALAALGAERRIRDLSGHDAKLLVQSCLLRQAAGQSLQVWTEHLDAVRATRPTGTLLTLDDVLAVHAALSPVTGTSTPLGSVRTCELTIHNVRAMLRFVHAYDRTTFAGVEQFQLVEQLEPLLASVAAKIKATVHTKVNRQRPALEHARRLMLRVMDPRHRTLTILTVACGRPGAYRVLRSHIEREVAKGRYRIRETKSDGSLALGYKYVAGTAAAFLEAELATTFRDFEARWLESREDYALLHGHDCDGTALVLDASASLLYIDPRFRLLLILGVKGRLEQQGRLSYRMLQRVEGGMLARRSPGRDRKRASDLVLCDAQLEAIAFECTVGFLAPLMKAYDATHARVARGLTAPSGAVDVHDFPLAPAGQLAMGQARAVAASLQPADDRTLWDWNKPLLAALGITGEGTSLRSWRRLCVDLYKQWRLDPDMHRLVTGHGAVSFAGDLQRDARQDTLQSTYFDQAALHLAKEAQAVMQHLRTTFPATGAPYQRHRTDGLR